MAHKAVHPFPGVPNSTHTIDADLEREVLTVQQVVTHGGSLALQVSKLPTFPPLLQPDGHHMIL